MSSPSDYVSVEDAGKLLGVSSRTVRNWIASGKLPAISGNRGRLVARVDVLRIGTLTGKVPEDAESDSVSERSSDASSTELPETSSAASIVTARSQLEAIRDEWLAPLVARIGELEREAGRLTAERNQAHEQIDALQAHVSQLETQLTHPPASAVELEQTQRLVEIVTLEREQIEAERDALHARLSALESTNVETPAPVVKTPETATDAARDVPWWQFWRR